eukprot:5115823-Pleurochrysis_carterae.AAC.5
MSAHIIIACTCTTHRTYSHEDTTFIMLKPIASSTCARARGTRARACSARKRMYYMCAHAANAHGVCTLCVCARACSARTPRPHLISSHAVHVYTRTSRTQQMPSHRHRSKRALSKPARAQQKVAHAMFAHTMHVHCRVRSACAHNTHAAHGQACIAHEHGWGGGSDCMSAVS